MSELVDPAKIESIVGVKRGSVLHYGRAVTAEERVYVLHSDQCVRLLGRRLDNCPYSMALDRGIDMTKWPAAARDTAVVLRLYHGRIYPLLASTKKET